MISGNFRLISRRSLKIGRQFVILKTLEVFAYWLTGVKPPTAEELLKQELNSYIEATIKLRDQSLQDLKEDVG